MTHESPHIGVYRGAEKEIPEWHNRNVRAYEMGWKEGLNVAPFDTLLENQIQVAVRSRRKQINIIDLGAGQNSFAKQLLSEPSVTSQSREALALHPDLHIHLIALTDAKKQEDFLSRKPLQPDQSIPELDNRQISAENVQYSVTSTQSIKKFFDEVGVDKVNLGVSVGFLTYLKPEVFGQVVIDLTERLADGGQYILYDYATMAGSRLSADDMVEDQPVVFTTRDREGRLHTISTQELREEAQKLLDDEHADEREVALMTPKINRTLMAGDVFPYPNILHMPGMKQGMTPRELLTFTVNNVIRDSESLVELPRVKAEKSSILKSLQHHYQGKANITYNNKGIIITKPES